MEAFQNYMNRQNLMSSKSILDFTTLSAAQKAHLQRLYSLMGVGVLVTALGVYVHLQLFKLPLFLILLLKIACIWGIVSKTRAAIYEGKVLGEWRLGLFGGLCFLIGMGMADYLKFVHALSPAIIPTAFLGSLSIFFCFSAAAWFAKERQYLYLGSILTSALSYLILVSFANFFFNLAFVHDILLYGGLLVSIGFIIYDTQITLEDFRRGNKDYMLHALELYMDLIGVFIRLLRILVKQEEKRNSRRKNER